MSAFLGVSAAHSSDSTAGFDRDAELLQDLQAAYSAMGADYVPRTEHFNEQGEPVYINRLIKEESPYLLQHAHNPVDWYPWGKEAFAAAKAADKPIFLSIGYATCHWCHVMERESFENETIANILNEHFIAVKVDREQRPDVDSSYMTAVQMMTGSGGWPLSAFLNPAAQPFYGGTYFPPAAFGDLLERVAVVWVDSRTDLDEQAEKVASALKSATSLSEKVREVGPQDIFSARQQLMSTHDSLQGGFGDAPKFPRETALEFLLDQALRPAGDDVLEAADFTLERIAAGGIHDHVGGGFHRYAVDPDWLIPHFEKMLYNQAALARVYNRAWQITGDPERLRAAQRTLDYVLRDMTSVDGLFFSATDADSDGGEGNFFIWTEDEIRSLLPGEDAELVMSVWGVTAAGNFEHKNILHLEGSLAQAAADQDLSVAELTARLDVIGKVLFAEREKREAPLRDEKILTAWNGMMITALAEVGEATGTARYINAAVAAADTLLAGNQREGNRLWRSRFNDRWSVAASQTDYAYLAEGLLALYDVTSERRFLDQAKALVQTMNTDFWDDSEGGYFLGEPLAGGAALPNRPKAIYDNAQPSGNAAAARVLVRLWRRTGTPEYYDRALNLFGAFSADLARGASNFTYLLLALSELQEGETGHRQFAANGNVRVSARVDNRQLVVRVNIAEGWHINSDQPLQDYLIGTSLMDAANEPLAGVNYPAAKRQVLGFQRSELALFDDQIEITAPVPASPVAQVGNNMPVVLNVQACNDKVCLAPETVILNVALADSSL
ncbi:MAG: DUF255 domain-containing protein [Gammaproteobacteria bacterium]|nr:DUF255 domain-containing protein [Gammaproteobacteria bacterium]